MHEQIAKTYIKIAKTISPFSKLILFVAIGGFIFSTFTRSIKSISITAISMWFWWLWFIWYYYFPNEIITTASSGLKSVSKYDKMTLKSQKLYTFYLTAYAIIMALINVMLLVV